MDLISVIVPVYNVEKYLDACVESIVNQTYKNLEIILVDDGSPDNCPAMCDAWAERDSRIRVLHKKNGGLSDARNAGMRICKGDYIGFIDSDDFIAAGMYEKLHDLLIENDADVAQCKMVLFSDIPFRGFHESEKTNISLFTAEEAVASLICGKFSTTCPSILSKREIALSTEFEVGMINEDVIWTYRILAKSSKVILTDEVFYAYYQRPGSIMNSSYSVKRFDALKALRMRADSIRIRFPSLYPVAERSYAGVCMYHYQTLCRLEKTEEYKSFKKRLHKMFCNSDLKVVFSVSNLKYKLWYSLFMIIPELTCRIRNIFKIGL